MHGTINIRFTKWDLEKSFLSKYFAKLTTCEGRGTKGQHLSHFALLFPIQTFLTPKHARPRRSSSTVNCLCVIWSKMRKVKWIFCNISISNFIKRPYVFRIFFLNIRIDTISRWDTKCPFHLHISVQPCSHSYTESKESLFTNQFVMPPDIILQPNCILLAKTQKLRNFD